MESTAYFHRIYGIVPWNPLNFHGINGKNLWHFMNFHNFLLLVYLPSTAMETLKTPSEYSVDFNRGFQGFSMANLETGLLCVFMTTITKKRKTKTTADVGNQMFTKSVFYTPPLTAKSSENFYY